MEARRRTAYFDPDSPRLNKAGIPNLLLALEVVRTAAIEACDVVFCDWHRYAHFVDLRRRSGLPFRLNQLPGATECLQHKGRFARYLRRRRYVPRTYVERGPRRLPGLWVEKPVNADRGEGISFLRDPHAWERVDHVLQRYVLDPWLIDGRKAEIRMVARLRGDGSARVYAEGLIRLARRAYTPDDLDPLVHNANAVFQRSMGIDVVERRLLSEVRPDGQLLRAIVRIIEDTTAVLARKRRFDGSRDFEILGYDIVANRGGTPYLIEANRFPGVEMQPGPAGRFYAGMLRALLGDA